MGHPAPYIPVVFLPDRLERWPERGGRDEDKGGLVGLPARSHNGFNSLFSLAIRRFEKYTTFYTAYQESCDSRKEQTRISFNRREGS